MLTNKKAVIFDLDGSLVDSMWIWSKVDEVYMAKYNLHPPVTFHKDIEGKSYTETAEYFKDTFSNLKCTVEEIKKEWLDMTRDFYTKEVALKPGAFEFIRSAHEKGMLFGIASSNTKELIEAVLRSQHVEEYFTSIRTSCEVAKGKPAPDVYLKVAEDLHVEPQECLVFEDVPKGIEAGINAGMSVCAVDDEFSRPDEVEKKRLADYFIRNYYDIENRTYEICGC